MTASISRVLVLLTGLAAVAGVLFSWNIEVRTNEFFAFFLALIGGVYGILDVTPKGRNEPPGGNLTAWVRRHDEYAEKPDNSCCHD